MASGSGTIRWDLVRKARARVADGQYEPPAVLDALTGSGGSIMFPILMITFLVANPLGIVFAIIAFVRSRVVPIWAVVALTVFAASDFGLPNIPFFDCPDPDLVTT